MRLLGIILGILRNRFRKSDIKECPRCGSCGIPDCCFSDCCDMGFGCAGYCGPEYDAASVAGRGHPYNPSEGTWNEQ